MVQPSVSTSSQPFASAARWRLFAMLYVAAVVLLVLRRPTALTLPQLWAEDGPIFFRDAWICGAAAFTYQYAGYLHLYPRLVAWLAQPFPLFAPELYTAGAMLAPAPIVWMLTSPRLRLATWQRAVMVLPLALPPLPDELHLAATNAHWYFTLLIPLLAAVDPPTTRATTVEDALVAALAASSSPSGVYLVPALAVVRWWSPSGVRRRAWLALLPAAGLVAWQALVLYQSGRPMKSGTLWESLDGAASGALASAGLQPAWFGGRVSTGLLFLGALAATATVIRLAHGRRPAWMLWGGAAVSWAVLVVSAASPAAASAGRYHFVPVVLVLWALTIVSTWRVPAAVSVGLVAMLHVADLRLPARPDMGWRARVQCVIEGRTDCVIPITPQGWAIDLAAGVGRDKKRCGHHD